eukprot:scaffold624_cov402-Prasinococcus_capsulatus_cf.AAC.28
MHAPSPACAATPAGLAAHRDEVPATRSASSTSGAVIGAAGARRRARVRQARLCGGPLYVAQIRGIGVWNVPHSLPGRR